MPDAISIYLIVLIFGLIIGSFLNVCIYRIPAGKSIMWPGSHCPSCQNNLRWYHNIPVLSYAVLRGCCSFCGKKISLRYPSVELLTGILFVLVFSRFGLTFASLVYSLFVALLIVITFIDLDLQIIPDVISLPGIVVGFLCSFLIPWLPWTDSLLGIILGGGSLFLVAAVYKMLTKIDGMGGGDIKLLAMIGAFIGWKAILPVIFISSMVGCLVGIPLMLLKGSGTRLAIPFGPFLALGAVIYLLYGKYLIQWYLQVSFG
ncbi:MAG: prepilin peptidase [Deltaproteobacteria bacterium]|nr:prepilin peptidase [Deltaproteobacteria bacterium]